MALLMLFALLAGAGTALSPCVLPVLPAVLGAGITGGRRRPLGVVVGLALSFTFATVALVYVIDALGLPDDLLRKLAIATLFGFGVLLLIPPLAARVEAFISRVVPVAGRTSGEGFGSGVLLGASLGLVYAPCAGPILAGVITVSAAQDFTAGKLAVALSYAIGSVIVLYALMVGGRRLADRLKAHRGRIQVAMGAVMVAVALAMSFDLDTDFQNAIADDLPAVLVNPTGGLEESGAVSDDLADVRGGAGRAGGRSGRGGRGLRASRPRARPGARRGQLAEHAGRRAADPLGAAGPKPGRADRLLDVHLHQLHPHAALHQGLGLRVPRPGPDRDRGPRSRVQLREGDGQRRGCDRRTTTSSIRSSRTTSSPPGPHSTTSTGLRST